MTVSAIVRELAEAIISAKKVSPARNRLLLDLLRMLPLFSEVGDLATWDKAYNAVRSRESDTSETRQLIQVLYFFAVENFYGAFQPDVQMRAYESLCREFRSAGITCPVVDKFVDI